MSHSFITDEELIDYLGAECTPAERKRVEAQLSTDPQLQRQLNALNALRDDVSALPEPKPSARADERFNAFLAGEKTAAAPLTVHRKPYLYRLAAIAASVLLVFALGWYGGQRNGTAEERSLVASRSLMLELMKGASTSTRIEATRVTLEVEVADESLIRNLAYLLLNDPNTNVQLAALNALKRFPDDPLVRESLLKAIAGNPPEIVNLQLIETLVSFREDRVLPYLQELLDNPRLPRHLRDAARMGTFKLI